MSVPGGTVRSMSTDFPRSAAEPDPSESGVPPDHAMISRALYVARQELAHRKPADHPSEGYWRGAIASLMWSLGESGVSPLTETPVRVNLNEQYRRTVWREADEAHRCIVGHRRSPEDLPPGYLQGVENTLHWVARGTGFITNLSNEAVRLSEEAWRAAAEQEAREPRGEMMTAMEFLAWAEARRRPRP